MRDAVGEGVGLAGSGSGNHQQRRRWTGPRAMLDGAPLLRVEAVKVGGCRLQGVCRPWIKNQGLRFSSSEQWIWLTVERRLWNANIMSILARQYEQIKNNSLERSKRASMPPCVAGRAHRRRT